ncbi:MAG: hypothetical protein K2P81_12770 [Bacteriovoracaceae bacterium]|nr:hypothetical protein [Bacteriovoracaceae bacterium]
MSCTRNTCLALVLLFLTFGVGAQTLVEEAKAPLEFEPVEGTFLETIKIISGSKKIFILTNNNQQLTQGDFISLALENNLAARAIVAKTHDGQVGIKIIKIYSLSQWSRLRRGQEVQIVRGDDSMFGKKVEKKVETTEEAPKIKSEEDLFDTKVVDDDSAELDDDSKRNIRPDNVVSVALGFYTPNQKDIDGNSQRGSQFTGAWAFQFTDNWFGEFVYARTQLADYPAKGAQTLVNNVVGRLKYNFKAPLYSFVMPYIGFQSQSISSNAGKGDNPAQNSLELDVVEKLKKTGPVFGVTLLRRLVPGWFLKADLGTDVLNLGVAVEF